MRRRTCSPRPSASGPLGDNARATSVRDRALLTLVTCYLSHNLASGCAALADGIGVGTWSIRKGNAEPAWFKTPSTAEAFAKEASDVQRFLAS